MSEVVIDSVATAVAETCAYETVVVAEHSIQKCDTRKGSGSARVAGSIAEAAASEESDIIPGKYEGGMKVWECSKDLAAFVFSNIAAWREKHGGLRLRILEAGCGHGLPGIAALIADKDATVHFCDYNEGVIRGVTIPNIVKNIGAQRAASSVRCFFGDWTEVAALMSQRGIAYDVIVSSDTVYCPDSIAPLLGLIKSVLDKSTGGTAYVAGRSYYFGVGGGTRDLCSAVDADGSLVHSCVQHIKKGVDRNTIAISHM